MSKKTYIYIGNWSFEKQPAKGKGVSLFTYNEEEGSVKLIETIRPEVAAGHLCLDAANGMLYSNDECGERHGEIGGGGYLHSYRIDKSTGKLEDVNRVESLSPEPAYLTMDKTGKYLYVSHVSDPFFVTKIVQKDDGTYGNEVIFCDGGLMMFRINDDGSIGPCCDVSLQEGDYGKGPNSKRCVDPLSGHVQFTEVVSRMHSVVADPTGEILVVCDKGMDKVYSYGVDRENGKLKHLDTWKGEVGCFPRYLTFNPVNGLLYVNNEKLDQVAVFKVDPATGKLDCIKQCPIFPEGYVHPDAELCVQDILVHPNGKAMYLTIGGYDVIVEMGLDADGMPVPGKVLDARGQQPRCLALSPDGRFLLSGNMVSGTVTTFAVDDNGVLTDTGKTYEAISPSAIRFYTVEE